MGEGSKAKRYQEKCSECRIQKKQCLPPERDWDANQEKCENCSSRGLDCGPNFRKKNDPAANPSASSSSTLPSASQPSHRDSDVQDGHDTGTVCRKRRRGGMPSMDREERSLDVNGEEFYKIWAKCKTLNAVGGHWVLASKLVGLYCGSPVIWEYDEHRRIASKLREYHHTLVNETINMILDIEKQGNQQQAIALMWKLWLTLQRYRGLCDSQTRGALFDMAGFFERNGDRDEHQDVLATIADITDPCAPKPDPDPCHLLATSILEDDDGLLDKFWQMHFPKSSMPSNVVLKPLQCAAQHGNPKVADTVLSRQSGYETGPAIFKLEGLHVAALKGNVDTLSTLIKNGNIDARTDHNQTPLFLAAAYGQESCCGLLLGHNADTNARDTHGHTILEVAAKGGNLNIVKMLVDYRADLVAPVHHCCSTPLQAAIESGRLEVVQYLLDQGVDVSPQRAYDNETALSLAQARDLPSVVSRLQNIEASRQSNQFMMPRSYNDERNTWR